ncbi:MAG: CBS domain-containing protein [Myxococcales bacterium]|nr:CBS domain-containing protein [Myxococcales bacterium]
MLYSAANGALSALGDGVLHALRDAGGPNAGVAGRLIAHGPAVRARLLVGRVIALALAAGCAALLPWGNVWAGLGAALVVALFYGVVVHIALAVVNRRGPHGAIRVLRWTRPLEVLVAPISVPLEVVQRVVERVVPPPPRDSGEIGARALEHLIEQGEEAGALEEGHAEMLRSVLEFRDTVAREVMIPRTRVEAFEIGTPMDEVVALVEESGHSRYPIYRDTIDHVEGVLYAKDLFRVMRAGTTDETLSTLMRRPALLVAETEKIDKVLREMQQRRFHLAVVVDEFGGVAGIATLEDVLEEIVGEIDDELDEAYEPIAEPEPGRFIADAKVSVYDLAERLGEPFGDEDGGYDSLGGMVVQLAGRVPSVGEELQAGPFDLRVLAGTDRHVERVEIVRRMVDAAQ